MARWTGGVARRCVCCGTQLLARKSGCCGCILPHNDQLLTASGSSAGVRRSRTTKYPLVTKLQASGNAGPERRMNKRYIVRNVYTRWGASAFGAASDRAVSCKVRGVLGRGTDAFSIVFPLGKMYLEEVVGVLSVVDRLGRCSGRLMTLRSQSDADQSGRSIRISCQNDLDSGTK